MLNSFCIVINMCCSACYLQFVHRIVKLLMALAYPYQMYVLGWLAKGCAIAVVTAKALNVELRTGFGFIWGLLLTWLHLSVTSGIILFSCSSVYQNYRLYKMSVGFHAELCGFTEGIFVWLLWVPGLWKFFQHFELESLNWLWPAVFCLFFYVYWWSNP